jgi:hypothetical protein
VRCTCCPRCPLRCPLRRRPLAAPFAALAALAAPFAALAALAAPFAAVHRPGATRLALTPAPRVQQEQRHDQ